MGDQKRTKRGPKRTKEDQKRTKRGLKWKTTKMKDDQNGRRLKWKTTKMEDDQIGRRPNWKMTKMEDDQNVRLEKAGVTYKNGPQIWTRGKILIKRRYLDNGAILQNLGTIPRVAAPVT